MNVAHQNRAKQWLERRKQNLDIMNLGGCLVTMDVVLLNFPVPKIFFLSDAFACLVVCWGQIS